MASPKVQQIAQQGSRHASLLAELATLDYASAAIIDASATLKDLQQQEEQTKKRLQTLKQASKKEYEEWRAVQQSKNSRFFIRLRHGGSKDALAERVAKEEREYAAAYEQENDCAEALGVITQQVQHTQQQVNDLQGKKARHEAIERELEEMYRSLFHGPTEDFPEEDAAEQAVEQARRDNDAAQNAINSQAHIIGALAKARMAFVASNKKLDEALQYSTYDMFSRGSLADYYERSALASAKQASLQAIMHFNEARRLSPNIPPLPAINIAQGNLMSDVLFDSFYTDYAMHQRIQQSQASLRGALAHSNQQLQQAEQRTNADRQRAKRAAAALRQARTELLAIRRRIVIDVAAGEAFLNSPQLGNARPVSGDFSPYADSLLAEANEAAPDYSTEAPPGYAR